MLGATVALAPLGGADTGALGSSDPDGAGDGGRRVGRAVGLGLASIDATGDGVAGTSPAESRLKTTTPNATTMSPISAIWVMARSSGQRVVGALSLGCSRMSGAVRAIGRRAASAAATAAGSTPGARTDARFA